MITFNHNTDSMAEAIGITNERALAISGIILFERINAQFQLEDLYDDDDDVPKEVGSKSSLLERVLKNFTLENETIFASMEFGKYETIKAIGDSAYQSMMLLSTMIYAKANKDKDKFTKSFVEHSLEVLNRMDNESED